MLQTKSPEPALDLVLIHGQSMEPTTCDLSFQDPNKPYWWLAWSGVRQQEAQPALASLSMTRALNLTQTAGLVAGAVRFEKEETCGSHMSELSVLSIFLFVVPPYLHSSPTFIASFSFFTSSSEQDEGR